MPLSHLAHRVIASNKFCPETCCIVGNYYSLKGDHEQVSISHRILCFNPYMKTPILAHAGHPAVRRPWKGDSHIPCHAREASTVLQGKAAQVRRRGADVLQMVWLLDGLCPCIVQTSKKQAEAAHHVCDVVQAVLYFRRALRLDRTYMSAWTLMGHEFVELKNSPAAVGMPCRPPIDPTGWTSRCPVLLFWLC